MAKQMSRQIPWLGLPLLAMSLGAIAQPAVAHSYPSSTIRIVLSGGAGTPPDIITRIVANELGQGEGWRIVVENKPGAIGTIAAAEVLKQPADGHTIFGFALPTSAAPALLPNISYRLDTDFAPVIKLITSHHVLVVNPSVPVKSMAELVALLKEQPDKFTFSSGGFGTPAHLMGELFKLRTGVRAAHVPYRALPQAIADLLNGTNHYQFVTALPVLDLIAADKLRALAVTAPERMPSLKDVPTVVEQGFPQLVIQEWVGWVAKSGTPDAIIGRLNTLLSAIRKDRRHLCRRFVVRKQIDRRHRGSLLERSIVFYDCRNCAHLCCINGARPILGASMSVVLQSILSGTRQQGEGVETELMA